MKSIKFTRLGLLLPLALWIALACTPKSPEEKVAQLRSYYRAKLIGIIVEAQPESTEPSMESSDGSGEAMAEEPAEASMPEAEDAMEGAMEADAPPVPVLQNVVLDILLQHDSAEKLPGITLDIEMVDADETRKGSWKLWVDTATLPKATGTQFTHRLEDVDYVEGDGFNVEVRSPVPPAERGEYREFAGVAGE